MVDGREKCYLNVADVVEQAFRRIDRIQNLVISYGVKRRLRFLYFVVPPSKQIGRIHLYESLNVSIDNIK